MASDASEIGHLASCHWCGEQLCQDERGRWVDVFDTPRCDHPGHVYHEALTHG